MSTLGGFNDKCGGKSLGKQLNLYGNPSVLDTPVVLNDNPLLYSMISPQCAEHPLVYYTDIMQGDNVCAVHRVVCSTAGDVQYTGGIS